MSIFDFLRRKFTQKQEEEPQEEAYVYPYAQPSQPSENSNSISTTKKTFPEIKSIPQKITEDIIQTNIKNTLYELLPDYAQVSTKIENGSKELSDFRIYHNIAEKALEYIEKNPGCLQRNMYKVMNVEGIDRECLKHFLRYSLLITKEKTGNTNKLFVNSKKM